MSPDNRQKNEEFELEIDSAVDSFFSHYEENAPKVDVSSNEPESDAIPEEKNAPETDDTSQGSEIDITSEEETALEMDDSSHGSEPDITSEGEAPETDDSSLESVFEMLSEAENVPQTVDSPNGSEPDTVADAEKVSPDKSKSDSDRREKKKFDPSATHVFNSLTEAILTVDWDVNEANVNEAREILEKIRTRFPVLNESRAQDVINGMMETLDVIAESPQRVSTSAMAQLEKAIPILRGIASGAQIEDGYDELIEDAIAGLEACRIVDEPAEDGTAESSDLMVGEGIPFDDGDDVALKDQELEPIAVPVGVSRVLCRHSEVVAQLIPRARSISELYEAAQGSENVQVLFQKICGLLELQARALQGAFSLNCDIAIFPIGKINNLSEFLGFQLKAMGVCSRHARKLEKASKNKSHRNRFWQSIYFLRIGMEKQIDELTRTAGDEDSPSQETESTIPAPL